MPSQMDVVLWCNKRDGLNWTTRCADERAPHGFFQCFRFSPAEVGQELGVEVDPVQHCQVLSSEHQLAFLVNKLILNGTKILCLEYEIDVPKIRNKKLLGGFV